jgi:hypothetical protein
MKRRYNMQRTPSYYKNWCTTPFFCLNSPRIRGWYQARVHPFSSGNGKGDILSFLFRNQTFQSLPLQAFHVQDLGFSDFSMNKTRFLFFPALNCSIHASHAFQAYPFQEMVLSAQFFQVFYNHETLQPMPFQTYPFQDLNLAVFLVFLKP